MVTTAVINQTGEPQIIQFEHTEVRAPGPDEVWLEQFAIGANPLDLSQRSGAVPLALPSGLGLEGAGRVVATGADVTNVVVGDRVAYATGPIGAYASARLYPANRLVKIPDSLSFEDAAASLFKGITAQYLLKSTYPVGPGSTVLIYGAAGALGQIMVPWARHLGAFVIGVVSSAESAEQARLAGCNEVLVFDAATLADTVIDITRGRKVDVVYDPIGRVSFEASLNCLRPRGLLVSFGMSSGAPMPVEISTLNAKGSLFLTRPSLAAHTATPEEYQQRAKDVLQAIDAGIIRPNVGRRYPLSEVAQAHADLHRGGLSGAVVLVP